MRLSLFAIAGVLILVGAFAGPVQADDDPGYPPAPPPSVASEWPTPAVPPALADDAAPPMPPTPPPYEPSAFDDGAPVAEDDPAAPVEGMPADDGPSIVEGPPASADIILEEVTPPPPASPCQVEPAPCADPCLRRCGFRLTLEGLYSSLPEPQGVFGEEAFTGNQMTWETLGYDFEFGGRAAVEWFSGEGSRLELTGSWYGEWSDSRRTAGNFAFSPALPGIAALNTATVSSEAELIGGEINLFREISCSQCWRTEWGIGARFLQLDEEARASNFAQAFNPGFPGAPFVNSEVTNRFFGGQLMARVYYTPSSCWEFMGGLDLICGSVNREITVTDNSIFAGGPHRSTNDEDEITFGLELELGARFRLNRCFSVAGGYRFLFLDDVVRANEAMGFNHSNSGAVQAQQNTDQLTMHTFFLGLSMDL